jgi:uncharacterized protein
MLFHQSVLNVMAKSPFKSIQDHMEQTVCAVELLPKVFAQIIAEDWDQAAITLKKIGKYESSADKLKLKVCQKLHSDLFLPVSKGQLISLLMAQESVVNTAEDIAGMAFGRKMFFPECIQTDIVDYIESSVSACMQASNVVAELRQVLESVFSGSVQKLTEEMIAELNKIESKNDAIQIAIRQKIIKIENTMQPIDVIFIYEIIKKIGLLADCAQQVGMQLIVVAAR